jgi:hypothetical protein
MLLLVTSASGINGNGYGALLTFKRDGTLIGPFNDDSRIVDPRSFGNRAVYGLVLTGISTASLRTRSSPSILRRAHAWVPQCNSSG